MSIHRARPTVQSTHVKSMQSMHVKSMQLTHVECAYVTSIVGSIGMFRVRVRVRIGDRVRLSLSAE